MSEGTFSQPISEQIWNQKYRFKTDREGYMSDNDVVDTWGRIATACSQLPQLHNNHAAREALEQRFFSALYDFKFLPAGRINSGAGTDRNVTLFNCYVMGTIPDSLNGIFDMLKEAALTMQQGGGIGYDFSTLRPKGAPVKGVESFSSGPLTFMDVWDAMCKTIMSAGSRRGAMMATMRCDHPDIMEFVQAKQDPLRLRNFNVSVLCTDDFMDAVAHDCDWDLSFNGVVYDTIKARDLWDAILQNTYDYAEPGVIFIDRINKENNLWFLETIAATNPCGEQPLPPYGACLLGSVNLARHVFAPFTEQAEVDMAELEKSVRTGVRLLDSVVDTSKFPLPQQEEEAKNKRRAGLGVTGLADLLFMTGYRYGSPAAVDKTNEIMFNIAIWAYEESIEMAKEFGPAPCLESLEAREQFIQSGFMQRMPELIRKDILEFGIRNTHLLSVAPTGTISMYAGNVSSGGEPIFAPSYQRKVTNDDGTKRTETVYDYAILLFEQHFGSPDTPEARAWSENFLATAQDLTPEDHIVMQAVLQKWVDSSISKTVNLPEDISFEDFKAVYNMAYAMGCKGCTTYRPNDVTGSILSVETKEEPELPTEVSTDMRVIQRGTVMDGSTYKLKWAGDAYYVTINHELMPEGWYAPAEIFVNTKNPEHLAWTGALTRMISAIFQRGGDIHFVADELQSVFDPKGGQWVEGRYVPSLVALIGNTLQEHLMMIGYQSTPEQMTKAPLIEVGAEAPEMQSPEQAAPIPAQCPSCKGFNMVIESGCPKCRDCGHSKCG
jgi:ribonucleoside-diphosphate reductase alpha chain